MFLQLLEVREGYLEDAVLHDLSQQVQCRLAREGHRLLLVISLNIYSFIEASLLQICQEQVGNLLPLVLLDDLWLIRCHRRLVCQLLI